MIKKLVKPQGKFIQDQLRELFMNCGGHGGLCFWCQYCIKIGVKHD